MKLTICNNCGLILDDQNPHTYAPDFNGFQNIKRMKFAEFWQCPECNDDGYLADVFCPTQIGQKGYFQTTDLQTGRQLATTLNVNTLEEWKNDFLEYYTIDMEDEDEATLLASTPEEVLGFAEDAGFSVEISATPFEDEYNF
jgi:rubredoxin